MKKESVDRTVGIAAIFISSITLVLFIYQTNIMHKQSRLSVTPRLGFSTTQSIVDSIIEFSSGLRNNGIGPALINNAVIEYNDKVYPLDIEGFFRTEFPELLKLGDLQYSETFPEGSSFAINESRDVFIYTLNVKRAPQVLQILGMTGDDEKLPFNMKVNYSSMFEEQWLIESNREGHPEKIK